MEHSLFDIYSRVQPALKHLFVVPLIRYEYPNTNYLALLYKPLQQNHPEVIIHNTSVFAHYRFVIAQLSGKAPVLHYHWLEFQDAKSLLGMPYKLFCIALFSLFGGRLIWTVHNLQPHDKKWLGIHKWMHRWMAQRAQLILVHSSTAKKMVAGYLNISSKKIDIFPHPEYPATPINPKEARQRLSQLVGHDFEAEIPIFLMMGAISEYKGFLEVIELLQTIDAPWQLVIAGYVKKGQEKLDQELQRIAKREPRLIYKPGFLGESEIAIYHSAADVSLFNFRDILSSGSVKMAIGYQNKIIAPKLGELRELVGMPGVSLFSSPTELFELLKIHISSHRHD